MVSPSQGSIFPNDAPRHKSRREEVINKRHEDQSRLIRQFIDGEISLQLNVNIGPNVNLKVPKRFAPTAEEKEFFKKKIKITKKTELCKNWQLYNDCYFKDNCSFAHGESELRAKYTGSNWKYKTKICKTFIEKMYCPFGNRCQYRHIMTFERPFSYQYINNCFCEELISEAKKFENSQNFELHKVIDYVKMNFKYEV